MTAPADPFKTRQSLATPQGDAIYYSLPALEKARVGAISKLPYSIRVLLEAVLRNVDGFAVTEDHVHALANYDPSSPGDQEIPFKCARVVLQDFTGVPALVDFAAMRSAMSRLNGDPRKINPTIPADLVVDHSVQVDHFGSADALALNAKIEFERNRERYEFLRWGQTAFDNFRVVPPATGIIHQVNLEYLAKVVFVREINGEKVALLDTLVGTDSHTTMINGIGVLGWGVGGIEAEAAMLGQPMSMLMPEVIGFRLTGRLPEGATATDLVLRVTQVLRAEGVVGKFVEFFGEGLADMSVADRATISNMAPEYGATAGYFPVDDQTLRYLRLTGRDDDEIKLVETYMKAQGLFRTDDVPEPRYTKTLELDVSTVEPSLAGPKRPQDRIALSGMQHQWRQDLSNVFGKSSADQTSTAQSMASAGAAATAVAPAPSGLDGVPVTYRGAEFKLRDGDVVIAAITSCTNTSNPSVMLASGIVAKKAAERGLTAKPWVKTSLAPGSRVVTEYLDKSGLTESLNQLGFQTVGYGCTTCIGNAGPLPEEIAAAIDEGNLVVSSVLSGNRNFEARIHPKIRANYLASPPLVVAFAIAGTTDIDLYNDPIGQDESGADVFLKDIWPTRDEIAALVESCVSPEIFKKRYADVFTGEDAWRQINVSGGDVYEWRDDSTYIQEPPFFIDLDPKPQPIQPLKEARVLCLVGDSVTTDHISPAGSIAKDSPASQYLIDHGVAQRDFNSYGSRRGNDRVMTRGTFANVRFRNLLAPGTEGGWTTHLPTGAQMSVFDASLKYKEAGTPLIVIGGKDYGMGSSRDWAAKGTFLLGVRAVIVESFERIHRTNLVCMGVLPLVFKDGENRESLGLSGKEIYAIPELNDDLQPGQHLKVIATDPESGAKTEFTVRARVDTPVEVEYFRNGGVLQMVLRKMR